MGRTTMGLVGCIARLLTDMTWPLKVLAMLSAFTSTAGKLSPAAGFVLTPLCNTTCTVTVLLWTSAAAPAKTGQDFVSDQSGVLKLTFYVGCMSQLQHCWRIPYVI